MYELWSIMIHYAVICAWAHKDDCRMSKRTSRHQKQSKVAKNSLVLD